MWIFNNIKQSEDALRLCCETCTKIRFTTHPPTQFHRNIQDSVWSDWNCYIFHQFHDEFSQFVYRLGNENLNATNCDSQIFTCVYWMAAFSPWKEFFISTEYEYTANRVLTHILPLYIYHTSGVFGKMLFLIWNIFL